MVVVVAALVPVACVCGPSNQVVSAPHQCPRVNQKGSGIFLDLGQSLAFPLVASVRICWQQRHHPAIVTVPLVVASARTTGNIAEPVQVAIFIHVAFKGIRPRHSAR